MSTGKAFLWVARKFVIYFTAFLIAYAILHLLGVR